jgi:hypothetical protein
MAPITVEGYSGMRFVVLPHEDYPAAARLDGRRRLTPQLIDATLLSNMCTSVV